LLDSLLQESTMLVEEGSHGGSAHGTPGHKCLTGCASTFHRAMRERRLSRVSMQQANQLNIINEKEDEDGMNSRKGSNIDNQFRSNSTAGNHKNRKMSLDIGSGLVQNNNNLFAMSRISNMIHSINEQDEKEGTEKTDGDGYNRERRRSSLARIFSPPGPDMIEGQFAMIASNNYEQFLEAVGTGPLSRNMVMRAKIQMNFLQTPDKQWQITSETAIKAKSLTGYATYNRKITQNKFKEGECKPEIVDDWDQRLVVTTLFREEDGRRLRLEQIAEKDQKFCADSTIIFDVDREDSDSMTVTFMAGDIIAWRKFRRVERRNPSNIGSRRHSII